MVKSAAIAFVLALIFASSGTLGRELQQLPILPPAESESTTSPTPALTPTPAPVPAPAPSLGPVSCALEYYVNAGTYNTLIELVEAASESAAIAQILDSSASRITLLAPTDAGIQKTLAATGLTMESLLNDPSLITEILTYHVLPSQIQASDLVDGYSFNTGLVTAGKAQSVAVKGNGATATFVGAKSSAPISGPIASACSAVIVPIDGLLMPSS